MAPMSPRPLSDEIQQTRPFRSPAEEAVVTLLRTAEVVRARAGAAVEPHGLTLQQYNVLRILRGAGERGLPTLEIADRMVERTPGITRLLDRLEAKGQVTRERCSEDRRRVYARLTEAGHELVGELDAHVDAANAASSGGLTPDEVRTLVALLDRIRD
jgi:DNA-binding MarR family transcriptional regulator